MVKDTWQIVSCLPVRRHDMQMAFAVAPKHIDLSVLGAMEVLPP
jgi:hypothetical protein